MSDRQKAQPKKREGFTKITNPEMSEIMPHGPVATAVYLYIRFKPTGWKYRAERIGKDFGVGRDVIRKALKTLLASKIIYKAEIRKKGEFAASTYVDRDVLENLLAAGIIYRLPIREGEELKDATYIMRPKKPTPPAP